MCKSLVILLVILAFACAVKKQICPLDNDTYETLFKLCEDSFDVPVRDRTKAQKAACVRFWRNREAFSVQRVNEKKVLCFNGKQMLKKSALRDVIEKEFMHCKGVGARKLKHRLRQRFEGVSEQRVQSVLSGSKLSQLVNAKFRNRAIGRPIRARAIQVSIHQWHHNRLKVYFLKQENSILPKSRRNCQDAKILM